MRHSIRTTTFTALLIAGLLSVPAAASPEEVAESARSVNRLVGAWRVTVTPDGFPAAENLSTFSADGAVINSSNTLPEGTAHGSWKQIGVRTFAVTFVGLFFDATGNQAGEEKVVARIELTTSAREFQGPFQLHVFDAQGHELQVVSGTVTAHPIEVEELP
jgi:hypothetical protein